MATSGTYTLTTTVSHIISEVLEHAGAIEAGETVDSNDSASVMRSLNYLLFQMNQDETMSQSGMKMWTRERSDLTLTAKISFDLKPSGGDLDIQIPTEIIGAKLKDTDDDESAMQPMSFAEYNAIANKTDTGTPSKYYYEKRLDTGKLYLDCVPSDTTDVITLTYRQPLEVLTATTEELDIENYYIRALIYNAAVDVWPKFNPGKEVTRTLAGLAEQSMKAAQRFNPSNTVLFFQPGIDGRFIPIQQPYFFNQE